MAPVLVLAVTLSLAATAAAGLALAQLLRSARGLRRATAASRARVRPLLAELAEERAVTTAELRAIEQRRARDVTPSGSAR